MLLLLLLAAGCHLQQPGVVIAVRRHTGSLLAVGSGGCCPVVLLALLPVLLPL
jgi:hypothetical protein